MKMTLEMARLRYGLDPRILARVETRLLTNSTSAASRTPPVFDIGDIEEAIMAERDVDVCPYCGTPYRAAARRCEVCLLCLACED
jgi:uncharacterized Zn-finger protein